MALAVVLDHLRVVDRDVGCALLEVLDRVAALGHHRLDQAVGRDDGRLRIVDELGLHDSPRLQVPAPGRLRQRPDREPVVSLLARSQLGLGLALCSRSSRACGRIRVRTGPAASGPPSRRPLPDRQSTRDDDDCDGDHHPTPSGHEPHLLGSSTVQRDVGRMQKFPTTRSPNNDDRLPKPPNREEEDGATDPAREGRRLPRPA